MKCLVKTALLGAVTLMALGTSRAEAQVGLTSSVGTVTINATKASVLTVAINTGGTQTLASLTDGTTNNFATPVNITTTWDLNAGASVSLVGFFTTPASALVSGANLIPSSWVKGKMSTGLPTTFTAFTQNALGGVGTAGGSLALFTDAGSLKKSRTDDLNLQLDLTGQAIIPGTYTGTLNLRAVVQ
jgi:hypothetical protein